MKWQPKVINYCGKSLDKLYPGHCADASIKDLNIISYATDCESITNIQDCIQYSSINVANINKSMTEPDLNVIYFPNPDNKAINNIDKIYPEKRNVFGHMHLSDKYIVYKFDIKVNKRMHSGTILRIGDTKYNFGTLKIKATHTNDIQDLQYTFRSVSTSFDHEAKVSIFDLKIGRMYHIEIIHTQTQLIVICKSG